MTTRRPARRSSTRTRRARVPTMWTSATLHEQAQAPGTVITFDALGGFTLTEKHNISGLIAVHYHFIHQPLTSNASYQGAVGLQVVGDDALALPVVNDPFTQAAGNWPMHLFFAGERNSDQSVQERGMQKSARRIGIDESLAFSVEVDSGANSNVEWGVSLRLLLRRGR